MFGLRDLVFSLHHVFDERMFRPSISGNLYNLVNSIYGLFALPEVLLLGFIAREFVKAPYVFDQELAVHMEFLLHLEGTLVYSIKDCQGAFPGERI